MTLEEMLKALEDHFCDMCIKLSNMVSDNKISSTNAKIVFDDMYAWYLSSEARVRRIFDDGF